MQLESDHWLSSLNFFIQCIEGHEYLNCVFYTGAGEDRLAIWCAGVGCVCLYGINIFSICIHYLQIERGAESNFQLISVEIELEMSFLRCGRENFTQRVTGGSCRNVNASECLCKCRISTLFSCWPLIGGNDGNDINNVFFLRVISIIKEAWQ